MPFEWPKYYANDGSWVAKYDSYDQHYEVVYYIVTPRSSTGKDHFVIAIDTNQLGENWNAPESVKLLDQGVRYAAEQGVTNTEYKGKIVFSLFD
jgi:hypothetical protein